MDQDIETQPEVTLHTYVHILELASRGKIKLYRDLKGTEFYAARELKNSGMLSEGQVLGIADAIVITPEGAMALESWTQYLKESSFLFKVKENLLRFIWVLVGAMAATIGNYFG